MLATLCASASALLLLVGVIVLGNQKPGYSHLKHTISELGEFGSPLQGTAAFALFLPVGLLTLLAGALSLREGPGVAALAIAIGTGYVIAAIFPCDPGSPLSGSIRQGLHNLGGAVQYLGGGGALLAQAQRSEQPFGFAGCAVLASAVLISVLPSTAIRGAVQRAAETILFMGLVFGLMTVGRGPA